MVSCRDSVIVAPLQLPFHLSRVFLSSLPQSLCSFYSPFCHCFALCNSTKLTINRVSSGILSQHHLRVRGDFCPEHPPKTPTARQSKGKELPSLLP